MTDDLTPIQRAILALQASGLTASDATAAVNEVRAQICHDLGDELTAIYEKNNPYRWRRSRLKWGHGMGEAIRHLFHREMQAREAVRMFRDKETSDG